jgi:hypothetical protein
MVTPSYMTALRYSALEWRVGISDMVTMCFEMRYGNGSGNGFMGIDEMCSCLDADVARVMDG